MAGCKSALIVIAEAERLFALPVVVGILDPYDWLIGYSESGGVSKGTVWIAAIISVFPGSAE